MSNLTKIKNLLLAPSDAVRRYLVLSPQTISATYAGAWNGTNVIEVSVWMQKGDNAPTQIGLKDYTVDVYYDGNAVASISKNNTPSFQFSIPLGTKMCDVRLRYGGAYVDTQSVVITSDGARGPSLRQERWTVGVQYMAGKDGEKYEDTVLSGNYGFYHCIKTHTSTEADEPGKGSNWEQYWERGTHIDNLATDIFLAEKAYINNLVAMMIQTGYAGVPHIEASGSTFEIYGYGVYPAIQLAVNDQKQAVLRFCNETTGEALYDLGPSGIMKEFSEVSNKYFPNQLYKLPFATRVKEFLNIKESYTPNYYLFQEGYKTLGQGDNATRQYSVSGTSTPSEYNGKYFEEESYRSSVMQDGYYVKPNNGVYMKFSGQQAEAAPVASATGVTTDEGSYDHPLDVYVITLYEVTRGKITKQIPVYFTKIWEAGAAVSVGCDEFGQELDTNTYPALYSYWLSKQKVEI